MTIVVNNPAIEDKRQVITLEFVNGTKFCMMSTPHRSKIAIDKGLYFNFSFIPASSYKRIAGGAQFAINTPGSGAVVYGSVKGHKNWLCKPSIGKHTYAR